MPELPEVETTLRGITPYLLGNTVAAVVVRDGRLRWPVAPELRRELPGRSVVGVRRRGKYLLISFEHGHVILHLGMSGSLRILPSDTPPEKHDHVDLVLINALCLRLRDPRRFGAVLWTREPALTHPLLANLGPEPWDVHGDYLHQRAQGRRQAVKSFIMNSNTVVGVGNIYANESLFAAGIHPARPARSVSRLRYARLASSIRRVLDDAIAAGGTTLRDFVDSRGRPGYFAQNLEVYHRDGLVCHRCGARIRHKRIGQRSAYFCIMCQR
ncbi:MAG: Formamidopyrimidine-DNA glycosylase [Chromatiales bacterium USCg_Taylor]|nr:MAG: Formamidopyrimidine-DNA glycosylase [Chromatiales bacterium USCg_Taylor]